MRKRAKIVAAARAMVNTPFVHQGRVPHVGLDCGGLAILSAKQAGVELEDLTNYPEIPDGSFIALVEKQGEQIKLAQVEPGDFIMFRFERDPQHIAIVTEIDPIHIIHTWSEIEKVVENVLDDYWKRRIVSCYRIKGVK